MSLSEHKWEREWHIIVLYPEPENIAKVLIRDLLKFILTWWDRNWKEYNNPRATVQVEFKLHPNSDWNFWNNFKVGVKML